MSDDPCTVNRRLEIVPNFYGVVISHKHCQNLNNTTLVQIFQFKLVLPIAMFSHCKSEIYKTGGHYIFTAILK